MRAGFGFLLVPLILVGSLEIARAAPIAANPVSVAFGDVGVCAQSKDSSVTFTNTSNGMVSITDLSIVGANPGDFLLTDIGVLMLPASVGPGFSATVKVAFAPQAGGARAGTLRMALGNNAGNVDVALTGNGTGPQLTITPNPVDVGGTQVGVPLKSSVTLSNAGGGCNLSVSGVSVGGPDGALFSLSDVPALPQVLGAGKMNNVVFTLNFLPKAAGKFNALLTVLSNDPNLGPSVNVPIVARAGDPALNIGVFSLIFGNQRVGTTSMPQPLTISNTGNSTGTIKAIQIDAGQNGMGNPNDFLVDDSKGFSLPVNASKTLNLSFQPTAVGLRFARVVIASDDPKTPTAYVTLSGTGTVSMLSMSPQSADFKDRLVYAVSDPQTFTLTNSGTDAATLTAIDFTGAQGTWFRARGNAMPPITIPAMGKTTVDLVTVPLGLGPGAGTVTFSTDDPKSPTFSAALAVNGVGPKARMSPAAVSFGPVPVAALVKQTVMITNAGTAPLNINTFSVVGNNAFDVANPPQNLPVSVDPGASFSFDVTFQPPSAADFQGEVDLDLDDPVARHVHLPLDGSGQQAGVTVAPMTVTFTSTLVGTSSAPSFVTITNTGSGPLDLPGGVSLAGTNPNQFVAQDPGKVTLAPGQSRQLAVVYQPVSGGMHSATLAIGGIKATIKLAGSAVSPQLVAAPTSIDFTDVLVESTAGPTPIGLKVPGSGVPVTITAITSSDPTVALDLSKVSRTLGAGAQTSFDVYFTPTAAGSKTATISISVRGQSAPIATVMVKGNGFVSKATVKTIKSGCSLGGGAGGGEPAALGLVGLALLASVLRSRARR